MVCFAEVTHFDTVVAFVLPDQEFLFQRIQVFRHKDELPSGRILAFMILHGQAFFYPSVATFIIASIRKDCTENSVGKSVQAFGGEHPERKEDPYPSVDLPIYRGQNIEKL